jgi:hypothetical protein
MQPAAAPQIIPPFAPFTNKTNAMPTIINVNNVRLA